MKLNTFTPKKTNRPEVGDIIFGEDSFIIGKKKSNSEIIEVGFTLDQCIKEKEKIEVFYSKGKVFENRRMIKEDNSIIDETRQDATWVVEKVEYRKELELLHSILPESYFVRARKMVDKELTDDVIEFYTFGAFQNTISEKLEVLGTIN